jgi:hypothetical protein
MVRKWMEDVQRLMHKKSQHRWFFPLRHYPDWQTFARTCRNTGHSFIWEVLPKALALRSTENKVVFDDSMAMEPCYYSESEHFARAYNREHVVIFVLRAGTRDSKFADVLKILQDLLQGIMFCRKRGVLAFSTPHILIFAEFAKPDGKLGEALRDMVAAHKLKTAPQAVPQPAPEAAPAQK